MMKEADKGRCEGEGTPVGGPESPDGRKEEMRNLALALGADVFGVADTRGLLDHLALPEVPSNTPYIRAICIGVRLSDPVIEGIVDAPTRTYAYHYRQVNLLLDAIVLRLSGRIQSWGGTVFPVPSSQIVDWEDNRGHISHKVLGAMAGIGWIGKSTLLVHPQWGARVRYASLLTDMDLTPAQRSSPLDCGSCMACAKACPGGAIGETPNDFDLDTCLQTIKELKKRSNIGQDICGICVKQCRGRSCAA